MPETFSLNPNAITPSEITLDKRLTDLKSSKEEDLANFAGSLCTLLTNLMLKSRNWEFNDREWAQKTPYMDEAALREYCNFPRARNTRRYDDDIKEAVKEIQTNPLYEKTGKKFKGLIHEGKHAINMFEHWGPDPKTLWLDAKRMEEIFALGPEAWKH